MLPVEALNAAEQSSEKSRYTSNEPKLLIFAFPEGNLSTNSFYWFLEINILSS
jgi:hypothetical protein